MRLTQYSLRWHLELEKKMLRTASVVDQFCFYLFNGISTSYGIFKTETWFTCKCLMVKRTIFNVPQCREEENLVFWFGAQFNSTLNFTQSGWLILFSPDLHFRLAKQVSGQTQSLRLETATRTDVPLVVPA